MKIFIQKEHSMPIKSFLVALALLAGFSSQTHATIVTSTAQGTITSGVDGFGVFGTAGANLSGKAFILRFTFDIDLSHNIHGSSDYSNWLISSESHVPATIAASVDGSTYLIRLRDDLLYNQAVQNGKSLYPDSTNPSTIDQLYSWAQGYNLLDHISASAYAEVNSHANAFIGPTLDLTSYYTKDVVPGEYGSSMLFLRDSLGVAQTRWSARVSTMSFNAPEATTAVPEPATISLLVLGLLGFAATRTQRKNQRT